MANRSQAEKEKGNSAFKSADYPTAVGHYSAAIVADRTDPTLPLNRAAAYLKLGKNEDAERDCTSALALPKGKENVKAYFRRAQARIGLNKIPEAKSDLQEALRLEPNNDAVKAELKKIEGTKQNSPPGRPSKVTPVSGSAPSSAIKPASKSGSAADAKPYRRRVPITIVEGKPPSSDPPPQAGSLPNSQSVMSEVSSRSLKGAPTSAESATSPIKTSADPPASASSSASPVKPSNVFTETREVNGRKVGGGIFRYSGSKAGKEKQESLDTASQEMVPPPDATNSNESQAFAPSSEPPTPIDIMTHPPNPPATLSLNCLSFQNAWSGRSSTAERWNLLNQIHPLHLPKLFLTSLEAPLLVSILEHFRDVLQINSNAKEPIQQYMKTFPLVPRFHTMLLFLTDKERKVVKDLVEAVGGVDDVGKLWKL